MVGTACEVLGVAPGADATQIQYTLSDPPLVVIGGYDDRPAYQLHYPVGAFRLSDGRIVLADAGPRELRYFDEEGRHLKTMGGTGEGPGEFRNLRTIARIRGDTIVAWDGASRRASFFRGDGDFAWGVTLTGWSEVQEELVRGDLSRTISLTGLHILGAGNLIGELFYGRVPDAMATERVIQDSVPVVVFDRSGDRTLTLGPFPGNESFVRNRAGMLLAFGERLRVAPGMDLVYVGSTRDRLIRGFSPVTGEVVRSIELSVAPRPLTPRDAPDPGSGPIAELVGAMPLPDSTPVFSEIHPGVDGRLWIQRYLMRGDRSQEWLAFDEEGDPVASLTMDPSLELLDIGGDYAIVLATDELDVAEIRMHRLVR